LVWARGLVLSLLPNDGIYGSLLSQGRHQREIT
jgi:hypothetical protein